MYFGFRISIPLHLSTFQVTIQNLKCPKNSKNAWVLLPRGSLFRHPGLEGFILIIWVPILGTKGPCLSLSGQYWQHCQREWSLRSPLERLHLPHFGNNFHGAKATQITDHPVQASLKTAGEKVMRFWCFYCTLNSEWVSEMCSDVMGSKFWIQNTCGKLKTDLYNWF